MSKSIHLFWHPKFYTEYCARDWERLPDGRIIKYMGTCPTCHNRVYGFRGNEFPEPLDVLPIENTASFIEAGIYPEGELTSNVIVCWKCGNDGKAYNRILKSRCRPLTK